MYFDPWYFIIIAPGLLLALIASVWVRLAFSRYSRTPLAGGYSGAEVARELLRRSGIGDVGVEEHQGFLSDHYHPLQKVVRLSPDIYRGRSVAAAAIAAHEVGHAIQHARRFSLMSLRQALVGPANLGSNLSYILIILGFVLHAMGLVWAGIILFSAVVLFQLVTLPVEIDASRRARANLLETGIVSPVQAPAVSRMLTAAALTYLAAVITSILTLVYYIMRAQSRD